jgi:carbamoyltransferase
MVQYVQLACRETGLSHIAAAGGTFANVVVNQRILHLPEVEAMYVHPAMTDQGISMGAGLAHFAEQGSPQEQAQAGRLNRPLESIYLGPGFDEEAIGSALENADCRHTRPENIAAATAELLRDNHVVARYAGRLEYGLRALGNRSLLYRPDDPDVNKWLNESLNRTEFMPFAPVTMAEHAQECYLDIEGGELAARYMTITFNVSDTMKQRSAGVVHLDDTARPQVIGEADNPGYYAVLAHFKRLTGIPTLINTSFNMHGEPIVCSPQDAIRAFRESRLRYMTMGPFVVTSDEPDDAAAAR